MNKIQKLFKKLSECTAEDVGIHNGVASVYAEIFRTIFKTESNRVCNCDGYWKLPANVVGNDDVYMLTEYKYGRNLKNKFELCKVIAQCVYYIHAFADKGMTVPKVVVVGDENECVVVPSKILMYALKCGSDFSESASNAPSDEKLMDCLMSNPYIDYAFVYDIDEDFDTEGFVRTIVNIAKANDEQYFAEINERNIERVWRKFKKIVFGKSKTVNENEQVSVFVHYITDHNSFFRDPRKPKSFVFNGKEYGVVDAKQFAAFCNHFGYVRSVRQKERLRATCDRFIEDTNRRMKGEFYTPTAFVDYAHDMISKEFGDDWKEKYVVWDCAWGTGNLTRDYKFKELYCSTLEQAELDIARNINPEATKFQFDFLNDDFEKLPEGLKNAFKEGKEVLFLINPPYQTAGNTRRGDYTASIKGSNTAIKEMMNKVKGMGGNELYSQFLYRIIKMRQKYNSTIHLALFCNPKFLTGQRLTGMRKCFLNTFDFLDGVIFNAGHFGNVSATWPITFNVWRSGVSKAKTKFPHKIIEKTNDDAIIITGIKTLYNTDEDVPIKKYYDNKCKREVETLVLRNALSPTGQIKKTSTAALGCWETHGLNAGKFKTASIIFTAVGANGTIITSENFTQVLNCFAVSKATETCWLNDKDELLYPNINHRLYEVFSKDAIVFSVFNALASSMRNVNQGGKLWNIRNEFFWMSREELLNLADNAGFEELYNDANNSEERFVYKKIQEINLSEEAQAVLDKASDIVRKSFKYRQTIHENHPEYHLNSWDAGWYQIKKLCAELPMMKDDMEEFKTLFKQLSDKMRPMVYELGFLKK